jgi:hypothetical protein
MTGGGFIDAVASGNDPAAYPSPVVVGTTTLDQFRMRLENNPAGTDGYITPRIMPLDNLYYADARGVTVVSNRNLSVPFDFDRNFATFDVQISNLQNLPGGITTPLRAFITARNAVYRQDDTIDNNTATVRYDPTSNTLDGTMRSIKIKTLRLDISRVSDFPLMLYVRRPATPPATGEVDLPGTPVNLTRLVMNIQENGVFPYLRQDPIDRKSSFVVEIILGTDANGGLTTTINGSISYEIVEVIPQT